MSVLAEQTEHKAKALLVQCLHFFDELAHLEMTAEDAFEARKAESLLRWIIGDYEPHKIIATNSLKDDLYALLPWPDVKCLMKYPWFKDECYLHQPFDDKGYPLLAYFVPVSRIVEIK